MIFIRIIRNYFFKLGHAFCARTVKNFAKSEQFISKPGPRSIGNILLADKICDGKLIVFGNIFELGDKVIWDHSLSSIENYDLCRSTLYIRHFILTGFLTSNRQFFNICIKF